jgi:hypothetical protein
MRRLAIQITKSFQCNIAFKRHYPCRVYTPMDYFTDYNDPDYQLKLDKRRDEIKTYEKELCTSRSILYKLHFKVPLNAKDKELLDKQMESQRQHRITDLEAERNHIVEEIDLKKRIIDIHTNGIRNNKHNLSKFEVELENLVKSLDKYKLNDPGAEKIIETKNNLIKQIEDNKRQLETSKSIINEYTDKLKNLSVKKNELDNINILDPAFLDRHNEL